MNINEWRERIESDGEQLAAAGRPARVRVTLKSERITVRLSVDEVQALDKLCIRNGIGRSTFIRMTLRNALGLSHEQAATASSIETG